MSNTIIGANVPRASESVVKALLDKGLIYLGEDNQLHVTEHKKSTTNGADQSLN